MKTANSLELNASRQFTPWLYDQNISLVFTTYQAGKLFFIGLQPDGKLSVFERSLERCMGLYVQGNSIYISSLYQLWRFENVLATGQTHDGYDGLFLPQMGYVTGDLDIHDLVVCPDIAEKQAEQLVFVNTLFSCLGTMSESHSFKPYWQPPFISKLAAEDRCHLNGLAVREGKPKYVTTVSRSDVADGWRDKCIDGGCVIDIETNDIVVEGLTMPHSPRWYRDRLWLLNSGTGDFGFVDLERGQFEPVAFCAGYQRGLAFHGDYAVVGLSQVRKNKTFRNLPISDRLTAKQAEARCGLVVIDLRTGDVVHTFRIEGVVEELYDVQFLPNFRRPMAIAFKTDEIRRVITVDDG
ncbi:TIGR03032 family protein [Synechocystis salina]|uniref:TIGR03032 family protein n=1 Tax=Synechocystis salina LEGE 00031 TaxID=1828736 RepID=A0ABR9VY38_9SYNC|nr:TIGR03032 family protein [Synechocystis salina]MBE9242899.1 TIGR03032 family protein [Synechocystis salina LEGE 00041]MBE9255798.1 TIGR03032 family protein [Synechocystis salina LEGE 00031]